MPKIILRNTETGEDEQFEPVDAREILSNPNCIYEVPQETRDAIGRRYDVLSELNVPQLQGDDAELQTGLSIEKYGREAVVKAHPENPELRHPDRQQERQSEPDKKEAHRKGK